MVIKMRRFFKKVINHAGASIAAGTLTPDLIAQGLDSVSPGQTSATDTTVPVGVKLSTIDVQYTFGNLAAAVSTIHWTLQIRRGGQTAFVHPQLVGGDNQRNQVFKQLLRSAGQNQNVVIHLRFKIPKMFRRVRDGDIWGVNWICDTVIGRTAQMIYKFEL